MRGLSTNTALAAGIPGEPAGLALMQSRYGRLPLAQSLEPAIRLARDGFDLYPRLHAGMRGKCGSCAKSGRGAASGSAMARRCPWARAWCSHSWRARSRPWRAKALRRSTPAASRRSWSPACRDGRHLDAEDLEAYKAIEREPSSATTVAPRIIRAPPPSSGGVALVEALNILSGYDLDKVDAVTRKHLIIEAMRRMHRDRAVYLGDPAFVRCR